jgi:hypothetical protein
MRTCREWRDIDACFGQRAIEFLAPVSDIAGRAVAIHHAKWGFSDVGELMKIELFPCRDFY